MKIKFEQRYKGGEITGEIPGLVSPVHLAQPQNTFIWEVAPVKYGCGAQPWVYRKWVWKYFCLCVLCVVYSVIYKSSLYVLCRKKYLSTLRLNAVVNETFLLTKQI